MDRRKLDEREIAAALPGLPGWSIREGKLHREFQFQDFGEAFGFMLRVGLIAERLDHHPDWRNVYNRVTIDLHTHDRGGITEFDLEFARRANALIPAASR